MIVGTPGWSAPFEFKTVSIEGITYIPLQLRDSLGSSCKGCDLFGGEFNSDDCNLLDCSEKKSAWIYKESKEIING